MKALAGHDVKLLLNKAAGAASGRSPWPAAGRPDSFAGIAPHADDFADVGAPLAGTIRTEDNAPAWMTASGPAQPFGIERRLVRRAEALWERLRGQAPLPPLNSAAQLLQPPFGAHAALFTIDPPQAGRAPPLPRASYVGSNLIQLELLAPGDVHPSHDPHGPVGGQLAAMAQKAQRLAVPVIFDSEAFGAGVRVAPGRPALMMRAIALPMAGGCPDSGATCAESGAVVIIASWRQILSEADTLALRHELAAAIAWMQTQ